VNNDQKQTNQTYQLSAISHTVLPCYYHVKLQLTDLNN